MGILDDAIREHLELKRAHGASEDEIRRQEAEVFGPVRQDVAATAAEEDGGEVIASSENEAEAATDDPYDVHPGDHPVPDPHDHAHRAGSDPAWGEDTDLFSEPAATQPPEPAHPEASEAPGAPEGPIGPAPVEDPPVEDPPVEEPPVEQPTPEPGEGEDVLEETPEFLQDAPEHDRLWFEQKPPRDFDFGE